MSLSELSVADRHRHVAEQFGTLIAGTTEWDGPTPVPEWTVRDIVAHLIDWLPGMLAAGSDTVLATTTPVGQSPLRAWQERSIAVQEVLDDERRCGVPFRSAHFGELTVAQVIDRFYTADVFMHSWDLAKASGQDFELDRSHATAMLDGLRGMGQTLRDSGQFGIEQPVADDASPGDQLMAFIGRNPHWRP